MFGSLILGEDKYSTVEIIIIGIIFAILAGFVWYYSTGDYVLKLAIILNIVWSLYFIVFLAGSIIIALLSRAVKKRILLYLAIPSGT